MYQIYIDLLFSLQIIIWKFKNFHLSLIFPSYSFWIKTTNTFLHFHTRFLIKFGQNLCRASVFWTGMTQKPYPLGQQIRYGLFPYLQPRIQPEKRAGGGRLCQRYAFRSFSKRHECRFWNIPNAPISLFRVVLNVPGKSVWINYFQGQSVFLRSRQTLIDLVNDACVSSWQQNCYFSRTQWTFLDKLWNSLLDY